MLRNILTLSITISIFACSSAMALPIDWNGVFGVDSTLIDNFRKIDQTTQNAVSTNSQEIPLGSGNQANASFQSYVFKLRPSIIVNDSATIKAEMTTGYASGGFFGDSEAQSLEAGWGNSLYHYNTTNYSDNLVVQKLYAELYADTATYVVGRHSNHWGLGALLNEGNEVWDRHSSIRDGVTVKVKLGNFKISPFYAKISHGGTSPTLTRATKVKEIGISLLYDNRERDMEFGVYYAKKQNSSFNSSITSTANGASNALGETDTKVTDLYFRKGFGKLDFAVEVPLLSGDLGLVYGSGNAKYKAKAIIFESNYELTQNWKLSLDAGHVSGNAGATSSFSAMYLHPNYQIANLLFRYNLRGISAPGTRSVYDSYLTNTKYVKVAGTYSSESWTATTSLIYAIANETASAGQTAFNHLTNKSFTASFNQEEDLGFELDFDFDYMWNAEVSVGSSIGVHFAGDYFAFTDTATPNTAATSYAAQVRTSINF